LSTYQKASLDAGIPFQRDVVGTDTGTDAMAGVLGAVDSAATSIGFPIRNMHTVSEAGHTGDVLASIYAIHEGIKSLQSKKILSLFVASVQVFTFLFLFFEEMNGGKGAQVTDFTTGHSRLDQAPRVGPAVTA